MSNSAFPLLTLLIFLPTVGAIAALLAPEAGFVKRWALGVAAAELVLAGALLAGTSAGTTAPAGDAVQSFVERARWIPVLGADYSLGADWISALLIGLTALLTLLALGASWNTMNEHAKTYVASILFLETGVVGAFAARDLLLFFVFWEMMLIPMYFLVGVCGGPRRAQAALKFFIYTTVGSLVMLVGIASLYLYHQALTGTATFDIAALASPAVPATVQTWLFLAFALAFAIKVPIVPLHTWIGDLYTQAPMAALVVATMMVKVGAYGFLRLCLPLFPTASAQLAPLLSVLAIVGIIYGGMVAAAQRDLIRLMAYSSVAHLGFVVLGLFSLNSTGVAGAVLQMINHGLSAGAIFVIATMLYARTGSTNLDTLGGLARRWPVLAAFFLVALFSSAGLPGLNGFVGEFLVLLGAFRARPALGVLGALGVIIAAVYLLNMYRRAMHGPIPVELAGGAAIAGDATPREIGVLLPLVVLIVWIGLFPTSLLGKLDAPIAAQLGGVRAALTSSAATAKVNNSSDDPTGPFLTWLAPARASTDAAQEGDR